MEYYYYSTEISPGFAAFILMLSVVGIIAWWKIFSKAGEPGWASLIPFYNVYEIFKITWGNGIYFLLLFIPIANFVILIITYVKLAKAFGKGGGFACGLIFLNVIFLLILAFSDARYVGPDGQMANGYNPNMQGGYNPNGYNPNMQGGYNPNGYNPNMQGGYNPNGYNPNMQGGYNPNGYNTNVQGGYDPNGYNPNGFNPNVQGGFDPNGYNQNGYNPNAQGGYNQNNYDPNGNNTKGM
uniref:DUF5684 domain-containing protein n=1 Tax=Eubacterium cellulosolvens TaxID=29322 RepID=UPI000B12B84D|nr:DUF5684 domain-containing protein [[Eubacterium] cellulosolvens]